ncbi:hypothetical protein KUTeg_007488 [Tegillarca granosa]|uniref:Uncharacterized protein n=1 Tax=Tegillarca granosa TaxID=220873 RepID=A0ABQ9FDD9_TEGGR|nr:hypothetical protein KUTeg_007488 [Tegillarca granosa]
MQNTEKTEGSTFSRSRSSSISNSMENVSKEAIQSLVFADSYARKTDCNGVLIPTMSEQWKDLMKEKEKDKEREKLQSSIEMIVGLQDANSDLILV